MTADELLHKFDVSRNSDVRTDRGRPLPFGRSSAAGPRLSWPNSSRKAFSTNVASFSSSGVKHQLARNHFWTSLGEISGLIIDLITNDASVSLHDFRLPAAKE